MKKILLLLFISILTFSACRKDENIDENTNPTIEYTNDGLQVDIPAIVNDTIIRNTSMSIEIINGNLNNLIPNQLYELKLNGNNFSNAKKGTTIIDNIDGRLWVIKDILSRNNNITTVKAFVGGLGNLFQNAIFKYSSGTNHSKETSTNPNKLPSYEAKLITANSENSWEINNESSYTTFPLPSIVDGISASKDQFGNIILEFNNFSFSENLPNNLPLSINNGTIIINNAVDLEMKFNPANSLLAITNPLSFNTGSIQQFKSAVYTTTELDLQFSANVNASLLETSGKIVDIFVGVPISPYAFVVLRLEGIIQASVDAGASFDIAPRYVSNDDFVTLTDYNKGVIPSLSFEHLNIENSTNTGDNFSNFEAKIKFEFITKSTVLVYGLFGPSGEISAFFDIDGKVFNDTNTNTNSWDISMDVGMSSQLSLSTIFWTSSDIISNQGLDTTDIFTLENEDFYNINLFKTPSSSQIIEGNYQSGITNNLLNNEIQVQVLDSKGLQRALVPVYFETTDGNGSFNSVTVITDDNGIASNTWTLGNNIGEQTAHIYVKDGEGSIIPDTEHTVTANVISNDLPSVTTTEITNIMQTTAISGGNVINEEGNVTEKGVVWSTIPNPTITDNHTSNGTGIGDYTSLLDNLTENTIYYVKAYATNSFGTGYGNELQFTTQSNNTVTFPGQIVWVEGGTFQMGQPNPDIGGTNWTVDEQPVHMVTLDGFHISKYEITNQQYADFMNVIEANSDGSYNGILYLYIGACQINYTNGQFVSENGKENYPVTKVSWFGAKAYAEYYGGRLPTEAEWEFSAIGGGNSNSYTYSGSNNIDDVAWYFGNSDTTGNSNISDGHGTFPIGAKNANELGIYDMSGNVSEWCSDWYISDYYSTGTSDNPQGPNSGTKRVFRGGSWGSSHPMYCRIKERISYLPSGTNSNIGFRPILP